MPASFLLWFAISAYPTYNFYKNKFYPEKPITGILKTCRGSSSLKLGSTEAFPDVNGNIYLLYADDKNTISGKVVNGELFLNTVIINNKFEEKLVLISDNAWTILSPDKVWKVQSSDKKLYLEDNSFHENFIKIMVENDCSIYVCGNFYVGSNHIEAPCKN